jgi:N-acetylglutamate synthase-like GNAT family acetyltransferase
MSEIKIRQANKDDIKRIVKLLGQLGYESSAASLSIMLEDSVASQSVIVATKDDYVVGLMSLMFFDYFPTAQKYCRITAIVVDDRVVGRGIGSKLIKYAKLKAMRLSCNVLEVTTSLKRLKTQAYYEKIGFKKASFKYVLQLDKAGTKTS